MTGSWKSPSANFINFPDPGDEFVGVKIGIGYRGQHSGDWLDTPIEDDARATQSSQEERK